MIAQPTRVFEHYTLYRITSNVNLASVLDANMQTILNGGVDDASTTFIDLGFNFEFDGVTYTRIIVDTNGWLILVDPTETSVSNAISSVLSAPYDNGQILLSQVTNNVLLCPWFDDLMTVSNTFTTTPITISAQYQQLIKSGLNVPPIYYNEVEYGVKLFYDKNHKDGRRTIVRWNCLSDFNNASTVIRFECIFYENGKIEFRYAPRKNLKFTKSYLLGYPVEDATIGIFCKQNRFRDFSYGLGVGDSLRQQYEYGGAVYNSSFSDSWNDAGTPKSAPYVGSLNALDNWPGITTSGCIFAFVPPRAKRDVLPRQEIRENDSNKISDLQTLFDDRKTLVYGETAVVSYPTRLQNLYHQNITTQNDLFTNTFNLTASINKVSEQFVNPNINEQIVGWSDDSVLSKDIDPTFYSGTQINGLQQNLKSKTILNFKLPVNFDISMLTSSSIYYYNSKNKSWNIPQNTLNFIPYVYGSPYYTTKNDITNQQFYANFGSIIEDQKGFGPIGNFVCSGTNTPSTYEEQTNQIIKSQFTPENLTTALTNVYNKTITVNNEYEATVDEVIQIPIDKQFLLEKAIINVPFAFGDSWFKDLTTATTPYEGEGTPADNGVDFAGPGITLALFNQVKVGNVTRRDLIMSATITHIDDLQDGFSLRKNIASQNRYYLQQTGFKSFGGNPAAIVTPVTQSGLLTYTGSVAIKMSSMTSNGIMLPYKREIYDVTASNTKQALLDIFNSKELSITETIISGNCEIGYINNFGRACTGFSPSGRSVFGKEFITSNTISTAGKIKNPFYINACSGALSVNNYTTLLTNRQQIADAITNADKFSVTAVLPIFKSIESPYLLSPEDKLVLTISKHRSLCYGSEALGASASLMQDVTLTKGVIDITLFGSSLQENKEKHFDKNEQNTNAIQHTIIGAEPIVDQFECFYSNEYISGSTDDYIAGNLLSLSTVNGKQVLSISERGQVFSKTNVENSQNPGTTLYDYTDSMSYKLQPNFERAGFSSISHHYDNLERYYDSLMPDYSKCVKINGGIIFALAENVFLDIPNTRYGLGYPINVSRKNAFALNNTHISAQQSTNNKLFDKNWTFSFPYESRYSTAQRQITLRKTFTTTYSMAMISSSLVIVETPPIVLEGLYVNVASSNNVGVPAKGTHLTTHLSASIQANRNFTGILATDMYEQHYYSNPYFTGTIMNLTSSLSVVDISKVIFGFGDLNTISFATSGVDPITGLGIRCGTNHFSDFRHKNFLNGHISTSPIIRGWKYGIVNAVPTYNRAYFRLKKFGQFRDMLEQRYNSKFYIEINKTYKITHNAERTAAVTARFYSHDGARTTPLNTTCQNLSFECTSSVPFIDGETRNRTEIGSTNSTIVNVTTDQFGQESL